MANHAPNPAPERSLTQRREALERANIVRVFRARAKVEIRAGRRTWLSYLDHDLMQTMKVMDLLLAIPKFGRTKVNRILVLARISPSKTLGGLSDRQRRELVDGVRNYTPAGGRSTGPVYAINRRDRAILERMAAAGDVDRRGARQLQRIAGGFIDPTNPQQQEENAA